MCPPVNGKVRSATLFIIRSLNAWLTVGGSPLSGYNAPENLQNYATYLNSRIRAYRELKHDAIHVQAENNRDTRLSMSLEEEARRNRSKSESPPQKAPSRSKTISGRKLRVMTVEKGLLRETRVVQKMIDALVECRVSGYRYDRGLAGELDLCAPFSFTWIISMTSCRSPRCGCW